MGLTVAGPVGSAAAAPGNPGTPSAPTTVYWEDFENDMDGQQALLTDYTGAAGETYTADPPWLINCNGSIVEFVTPVADLGTCGNTTQTSFTRQLAYALGVQGGSAAPETNHAVTAFTAGDPGANQIQFATVDPIALPSVNGRFLTFSVDTAAVNCNVSAPLYQFSLMDGSTPIPVGGQVNACTSPTTVTAPAVGVVNSASVRVGTYTSDGSTLFSGSTVGIRMTNANGSGSGNDAAFDNVRILDATPQLDKAFSPDSVEAGQPATLTFTVTNTSELASKEGWSFTDELPAGLTVTEPAAETTCPSGVVDAEAGSSTVAVTGNLAAGMASCEVTVQVTGAAGTYSNGPSNVTATGLDAPGDATVTFTEPPAPALTATKTGYGVAASGSYVISTGASIKFTITVTNSGNVPIDGIVVDDPTAGPVTCPIDALAPGQSTQCTVPDHVVTAEDVAAGQVTNTATATGLDPDGGSVTSDPATATVEVTAPTTVPTSIDTGYAGTPGDDGLVWLGALVVIAGAAGLLVLRRRHRA